MVVILILFVCLFSSLSQGLNDFSNCSAATKCMQCFTKENIATSLPIDCDVKNISEYQYEISCENIINDNCSVVNITQDEFVPRHVCFYQLNFFNETWKLLAGNIPTSIGDTCDTVRGSGGSLIFVSPNCSNFFQRSSISDIYNNPYSCYCYNDNCNILNTITVEITNKDTPVISYSVDIGVYSSDISPSLVYDTTHVTSSVSSSTTGYINSYVTSSISSLSSLFIPFSSSYSLQNSTSSQTQTTTPSYVTTVTSSPTSFSPSNHLSSASNSFTYSSFVTQITTTVSITPNNDNVSREAGMLSILFINPLIN